MDLPINDASFSDVAREISPPSDLPLKLYIWSNPYSVSWGSSLLFAIAHSEEDARQIAAKSKRYSYNIYEQDGWDMSKIVLEKPDRVLDVPCAEWHEWEE